MDQTNLPGAGNPNNPNPSSHTGVNPQPASSVTGLNIRSTVQSKVRGSVTLKLLAVGVLILIMLIPLPFITSLIRERSGRQTHVINEVGKQWGSYQVLQGPYLDVPYQVTATASDGKTSTSINHAYFLPEELHIAGEMSPERKRRGIYEVLLYSGDIKISGTFKGASGQAVNLPEADLQWQNARFCLGLPGVRGLRNRVQLQFDGKTTEMGPGVPSTDIVDNGISCPVVLGDSVGAVKTFSLQIQMRGTSGLQVTPVGKDTYLEMQSAWNKPSFRGVFLPDKHNITDSGFKANWHVIYMNRTFPQAWVAGESYNLRGISSEVGAVETDYDEVRSQSTLETPLSPGDNAAFGVDLLTPLNHYLKVERSTKYAIMFIVLMFTSFFFMEVVNKRRIHPVQYLLVGASIVLFYVLLLSISEHLSFGISYGICTLLITGLLTYYFHSVFDNKRQAWTMSGLTALLYLYFYALMEQEDYSLLAGSLGLLVVLAAIMYFTRRVNWYALGETAE